MKLEVYSVYDKAVSAFMSPFYVRARGEALRSFMSAVGEEGHQFAKNAGDYTLFQLGFFDDGSGEFEFTPDYPMKILSALEVQREPG